MHSIRTGSGTIRVSAPYALPISQGIKVEFGAPQTQIWILIYAQAQQLDGTAYHNIFLLPPQFATPVPAGSIDVPNPRRGRQAFAVFGFADFDPKIVASALARLGFGRDAGISVLAVEMMPQDDVPRDPLGGDIGRQRILRTSLLTSVPRNC
jgi:hypothetical protein